MLYAYKAEIEGDWMCGAENPEYGKYSNRKIEGIIEVTKLLSYGYVSAEHRIKHYLEGKHGKGKIENLEVEQVPTI